jgi:hypothetical protein
MHASITAKPTQYAVAKWPALCLQDLHSWSKSAIVQVTAEVNVKEDLYAYG